jgi:hypothetical protein
MGQFLQPRTQGDPPSDVKAGTVDIFKELTQTD